jgi:MOSC domain-containing protein YiiM
LFRVEEVEAVAGRGLAGDRHLKRAGSYTTKLGAGREVTLIELESLDALAREQGIVLAPLESRRNLVTRGVRLNDLVGLEFLVGRIVLRGVRLCEPCEHLSKLTGRPLVRGLGGRGGLRAAIVEGGPIRVGDRVSRRVRGLFEPA